MQPAMSSIPTIARSEIQPDDPVRGAVRSVFQAMKADWGARFTKQFVRNGDASDLTENTWCWRMHDRAKGFRPESIIDGYDRAVRDSSPHMPSLNEIVEAARKIDGEKTRTAEHIAEVAAPRVNGLAGYVEHLANENADNTLALGCIETMREILTRPNTATTEERNARLDKAMSAHTKIMALAPPIRHRGAPKTCPVHECGRPGAIAKTTHADDTSPYFCPEHFRNG